MTADRPRRGTPTAIAGYIRNFTPTRLDQAAWSLAGPASKSLVRRAQPVSIAHARLLLSHLAGYLADPDVWDAAQAPTLRELLRVETINAHLTRTTFSSPRTKATHRDTLYKLARTAGNLDPVAPRPVRRGAPDAFFLAGASQPIPAAHLLQARRTQAPAPIKEWLRPLLPALTRQVSNGHIENTRTVMPSDVIRTLTEAPNREPNVSSTQTPGSPVQTGKQAATPAKPTSRRARIAAAKAAQKVRAEQAGAPRTGIVRVLPTGADLPDEVRARVASFTPQKATRQAWNRNAELGAGLVFATAPYNPRVAQSACSYVALLLTYVAARHGRDAAEPLTLDDLYAPGLLDEWLDQCHWSDRSKASARSLLRRALRAIDPSTAPARLEHHKVAAPYTREECDWYVRAAWHQPTVALTRDMCLIVGLGLGAGLDATDLRALTPECFTTVVAYGEQTILTVRVPGDGVKARTVPIRTHYAPLVQRGLDLHAKTKKPSALVIGKVRDRNNVVGPVTSRAKTAGSASLELRMSRLRNTWLVAQLCAPISLADLLPVAGLASARTVTELISYCPPADEAAVERIVSALAGADGAA